MFKFLVISLFLFQVGFLSNEEVNQANLKRMNQEKQMEEIIKQQDYQNQRLNQIENRQLRLRNQQDLLNQTQGR